MRELSCWVMRTHVAIALAMVPAVAHAATTLRSSLKPTCVTTNCSQIQFVLDIESNIYVDWVLLSSSDPEVWMFRSLISATDADGTTLDWSWQLSPPWTADPNSLYLKAGGHLAPEPIYLTVEMEVFRSDLVLYGGLIQYDGFGNLELDGLQETQVNFDGSAAVTPEPATMILLGTGLAGVAGAARRRRRRTDEEV